MSTWAAHDVTCPGCETSFTVQILKGMHITRLPEVQQQLRDGTFQVFTCPSCQQATTVERTSVYTDFERGHYIAVEPSSVTDVHEARQRHQRVFDESFELGPEVAQQLGRRLTTRLVFGLPALREKILCWDNDLDDHVVEGVKLVGLNAVGGSPETHVLRLTQVLPDGGHLLFAVYKRPLTPGSFVPDSHQLVLRSSYEAMLADPQRLRSLVPWVFRPWLVDVSLGQA